jgi:hypothetical protein
MTSSSISFVSTIETDLWMGALLRWARQRSYLHKEIRKEWAGIQAEWIDGALTTWRKEHPTSGQDLPAAFTPSTPLVQTVQTYLMGLRPDVESAVDRHYHSLDETIAHELQELLESYFKYTFEKLKS